jgi:crotonobetainyl-CoA:carnitine CoA-transferase CaiB-like acyl-CoA transferase
MQFLHHVSDFPGLHRAVPVSGLPVQLSATPARPPERPPLLGEHTDAVLAELGYSPADIAEFRAHRVI